MRGNNHPVTGRNPYSAVPSGEWTYRVALVSVEGLALVATCEPMPRAEAPAPAVAELEEALRQYRILETEGAHCSVHQTTASLQRETRVIVATWVQKRIGDPTPGVCLPPTPAPAKSQAQQ